MRILYVGNDAGAGNQFQECPNARYISSALRSLGHEVTLLHEFDTEWEEVVRRANKHDLLLTEELRMKGDYVVGNDGHDMIGGAFDRRRIRVPVVAWLNNLYFGIMPREIQLRTNPIFTRSDVVFSTDGGHDEGWKGLGIDHVLLRQGIDESEAAYGEPTYPTKAEIAFVGSIYGDMWPYRQELVDKLKGRYGSRFEVFGQRGDVRHECLNNLLATVKVVIGDSVYSPHYWSNRIYEMIGRGGFLIHPMIQGIEKEFVPYEHFVPYEYNDFDGLFKKVDWYLSHDDEREKIRKAGFDHCRSVHTYKKRAETLLAELKKRDLI